MYLKLFWIFSFLSTVLSPSFSQDDFIPDANANDEGKMAGISEISMEDAAMSSGDEAGDANGKDALIDGSSIDKENDAPYPWWCWCYPWSDCWYYWYYGTSDLMDGLANNHSEYEDCKNLYPWYYFGERDFDDSCTILSPGDDISEDDYAVPKDSVQNPPAPSGSEKLDQTFAISSDVDTVITDGAMDDNAPPIGNQNDIVDPLIKEML